MIKQLSKRLSIALCAGILVVISIMPAFAQREFSADYAVTDDAEYFTQEEFEALCDAAYSAGAAAGFSVAVHTKDGGVDASEMESYYTEYHDNDSSYTTDGVMLVFDTKSDNRIILTFGSAEKYFDDARMEELKSAMKPYLGSGDYYQAALAYIDKVKEFAAAGVNENGEYTNIVETPQGEQNKLLASLSKFGWIGGIAGVVIAIIFVLVNVGRYKYNGKSGTYDLNKNSELNLIDKQDVFLNKHTTYVTIQSSSGSSGSSSSGGSSSHGSSGSF